MARECPFVGFEYLCVAAATKVRHDVASGHLRLLRSRRRAAGVPSGAVFQDGHTPFSNGRPKSVNQIRLGIVQRS
jgi:hypothetical protein